MGEKLVGLPMTFCWTKYGVEAGESVASILHRKELERTASDGVFLWGIGSSIRPSLLDLVSKQPSPEILFTPMLSPALRRDIEPDTVVAWHGAVGIDGNPFELPACSLVTSRWETGARGSRHYALVCYSDRPLPSPLEISGNDPAEHLDEASLRNLRTGARVGWSQVTSVVRREATITPSGRRYDVTFRATLRFPYLLKLVSAEQLPRRKQTLAGVHDTLWRDVPVDAVADPGARPSTHLVGAMASSS